MLYFTFFCFLESQIGSKGPLELPCFINRLTVTTLENDGILLFSGLATYSRTERDLNSWCCWWRGAVEKEAWSSISASLRISTPSNPRTTVVRKRSTWKCTGTWSISVSSLVSHPCDLCESESCLLLTMPFYLKWLGCQDWNWKNVYFYGWNWVG